MTKKLAYVDFFSYLRNILQTTSNYNKTTGVKVVLEKSCLLGYRLCGEVVFLVTDRKDYGFYSYTR
jgi:hypothetical protein